MLASLAARASTRVGAVSAASISPIASTLLFSPICSRSFSSSAFGASSSSTLVVSSSPSWTPAHPLSRNVPRRHMGLMDRIASFADGKKKEAVDAKKLDMFKQQLDFLTNSPTYTPGDHLKLLEELASKAGATGWRKMLLTDAQKSDLEDVLIDLKLADILTPAELADVKVIDATARDRVAKSLGVPVARVNRFLDGYMQSLAVHKWLATRKAAGKAIPETMEEYMHTMMADKVGVNAETMKKAKNKFKHQKSMLRRSM